MSGALAVFSSRASDPNWDKARKKRAEPYQAKMDAYRRNAQAWKKRGSGILGRWSWDKKPEAPKAPAELAPYVKGLRAWGLEKFFDETKVKRAEDGKFSSKGGAGIASSRMAAGAPKPRMVAGIYSRGRSWEDTEDKVRDPAKQVRPTKDMPHQVRAAYAKFRDEQDRNPPAPPKGAARAKLAMPEIPESGIYKGPLDRRPQVPDALGVEGWKVVGRWAWKRAKDVQKDVIAKATADKLIPPGTDERDVRAAYSRARDVALHDVGLFNLAPFPANAMTAEGKKRLGPLLQFTVYARRRLNIELRNGDATADDKRLHPGLWAPFRRQFGKPFKGNGKVYAKDTRGQKAGEEKRTFYRYEHHTLLKAWTGLISRFGGALASSRRAAGAAVTAGRRASGLAGARYGAGQSRAWTPQMSAYRRANGGFQSPTERVYGPAKGFRYASNAPAAQSRRLDRGLKRTSAEFDRTDGRGTRIAPTYRGTIAARRATGAAAAAGVAGGTAIMVGQANAQANRVNADRRKSLYGTRDLAKRTPGAPLSEAELEQRREAAKARWANAATAAVGTVAAGAGGAAAVVVSDKVDRVKARYGARKALRAANARGEIARSRYKGVGEAADEAAKGVAQRNSGQGWKVVGGYKRFLDRQVGQAEGDLRHFNHGESIPAFRNPTVVGPIAEGASDAQGFAEDLSSKIRSDKALRDRVAAAAGKAPKRVTVKGHDVPARKAHSRTITRTFDPMKHQSVEDLGTPVAGSSGGRRAANKKAQADISEAITGGSPADRSVIQRSAREEQAIARRAAKSAAKAKMTPLERQAHSLAQQARKDAYAAGVTSSKKLGEIFEETKQRMMVDLRPAYEDAELRATEFKRMTPQERSAALKDALHGDTVDADTLKRMQRQVGTSARKVKVKVPVSGTTAHTVPTHTRKIEPAWPSKADRKAWRAEMKEDLQGRVARVKAKAERRSAKVGAKIRAEGIGNARNILRSVPMRTSGFRMARAALGAASFVAAGAASYAASDASKALATRRREAVSA